MSSCWKLTSVYYYNSLALKKCCLTTSLKIFPMKSFYFNFLCLVEGFWLGFGFFFLLLVFVVVCISLGFFYYFKREMARERGNLSKLFKCCLKNGPLCPLSAVLAGIPMCSHKSSTD